MNIANPPDAAILPFPDMEGYLVSELQKRFGYNGITERLGNLFCIKEEAKPPHSTSRNKDNTSAAAQRTLDVAAWSDAAAAPYFASSVMLHPQIAHFTSIGEASSILRGIQRLWSAAPYTLFRRTALIQDKLPHVNMKPRTFPTALPKSPMGLFVLLDEHTMLYSAETTSPLPCGHLSFVEDHVNPPSRAYLKLQEALTIASMRLGSPLPQAGNRCLDAGACPGGWTWVLSGLGCDVLAIDRSPLSPALMNHPHVTFRAHDAFTILPSEVGACDWVCSDVACYPERLFTWVKGWIDSTLAANMVCTIKIQGEVDYALIRRFAALPGSIVVHLNANKHELTFLHRRATQCAIHS